MFGDIPYEDWCEVLDSTAEQLLWEADVAQPPVDAFLVAMRLGVVVTQDEALPVRAQFLRLAGVASQQAESSALGAGSTPTIVLGEELRFERRQFAVAHELGEFAAQRVFDRLGIRSRHIPLGSREQVANTLAGRLLLPRRWFAKHGMHSDWDLPELKETFWTASHELIARRMLDMSPKVVVTVFDLGQTTWRSGNIGSVGSFSRDEIDCWNRCHNLSSPVDRTISVADGPTRRVRCWPVHEPSWKREIMRVDLCVWDA